MKIQTNEKGRIQIEELYNGVDLVTDDHDIMGVQMRDGGFEFSYGGRKYEAKKGNINQLSSNQLESGVEEIPNYGVGNASK